MVDKVPMTPGGHTALEVELKRRQSEDRPRIIELIAEARSHGDLSENAEYHAAKEEQSHNEGRIAEIEDKLARAEVIDDTKLSGDTIKFGATVTLIDEDTEKKAVWQIVGETEADAKKGRISITSPLARALIGKTKGSSVEVMAPGGAMAYEMAMLEGRCAPPPNCKVKKKPRMSRLFCVLTERWPQINAGESEYSAGPVVSSRWMKSRTRGTRHPTRNGLVI
jgi:transcription elongation factor GreA